MAQLYDELRSLATDYLQRERPGHTLQPTALVHEAYLRLADLKQIRWRDETHFQAAAAGTIRRVLVDHARAKGAAKRGAGRERVTLSGIEGVAGASELDLLALDVAIEKLATLDERKAQVVELRFFGGLTIDETAATLGVGTTTVEDDWAFARSWLGRELREEDAP
jgi:RNA polymerase sigma factor (TIGR02999 family)